jgi:uncharacterized protein (DUF1684 family)
MRDEEYIASWQQWRRQRDAELRDMYDVSCPTFPPDPRWVVTAAYRPYARPRVEAVGTSAGFQREVPVHGRLEFVLDGVQCTLEPYSVGPPGRLNVAFRDATSGESTYPLARVVFPAEPTPGESAVVIDFNCAINPPCAFVALATCALPPAGNTLPVRVEAGERMSGIAAGNAL